MTHTLDTLLRAFTLSWPLSEWQPTSLSKLQLKILVLGWFLSSTFKTFILHCPAVLYGHQYRLSALAVKAYSWNSHTHYQSSKHIQAWETVHRGSLHRSDCSLLTVYPCPLRPLHCTPPLSSQKGLLKWRLAHINLSLRVNCKRPWTFSELL